MPLGHPDFGEVFVCECRSPALSRKLQEISGLSERERQRRLSDLETEGRPGTQRMVEACRAFCESPMGLVLLWGGPGNGKTMALQAVTNELTQRGVEAIYITTFDLLGNVQEAYDASRDDPRESAPQRLRRFETAKVLALDEFDKAYESKWAVRQLTHLIEKRHRLGEDGTVGTLIAMNADPAHQLDWIESRLMDGRNRVVHNEDSDIRPALTR